MPTRKVVLSLLLTVAFVGFAPIVSAQRTASNPNGATISGVSAEGWSSAAGTGNFNGGIVDVAGSYSPSDEANNPNGGTVRLGLLSPENPSKKYLISWKGTGQGTRDVA